MLVRPDCVPCYLTQALNTLRKAGVTEPEQTRILGAIAAEVQGLSADRTPSYNSTLILQRLNQMIGLPDPFRQAKQESNRAAEKALDRAIRTRQQDGDALLGALKLAVAGNVIDMGIIEDYDIDAGLGEARNNNFNPRSLADFRAALQTSRQVLIVGDNSGEIVFDRVLVEVLQKMGKEVTYAVKGGPILNDATMEDVRQTGMDRLTRVIDNGNDFLGTEWEHCSDQFKQAFTGADLVIAKGQANYESLEGTEPAGDKTFFLLKAKCPVVADHLGVPFGTWVLAQNVKSNT